MEASFAAETSETFIIAELIKLAKENSQYHFMVCTLSDGKFMIGVRAIVATGNGFYDGFRKRFMEKINKYEFLVRETTIATEMNYYLVYLLIPKRSRARTAF